MNFIPLLSVNVPEFNKSSHISVCATKVTVNNDEDRKDRWELFTGRNFPLYNDTVIDIFNYAMDAVAEDLHPANSVAMDMVIKPTIHPHYSIVDNMWNVSGLIKTFKNKMEEFSKERKIHPTVFNNALCFLKKVGIGDSAVFSKFLIANTSVCLSPSLKKEKVIDVDWVPLSHSNLSDFNNATHFSLRIRGLSAQVYEDRVNRLKMFIGKKIDAVDPEVINLFDYMMHHMITRFVPVKRVRVERVLIPNVNPHFSIIDCMWDVSKIIENLKIDAHYFGKMHCLTSKEIKHYLNYLKACDLFDYTKFSKALISFIDIKFSFIPTSEIKDTKPTVSDNYNLIVKEVDEIASSIKKGVKGISLLKNQIEPYLATNVKEMISTPYGETLLVSIVSNLLISMSALHNQEELACDVTRCLMLATSDKSITKVDLSNQLIILAKGMGVDIK